MYCIIMALDHITMYISTNIRRNSGLYNTCTGIIFSLQKQGQSRKPMNTDGYFSSQYMQAYMCTISDLPIAQPFFTSFTYFHNTGWYSSLSPNIVTSKVLVQ